MNTKKFMPMNTRCILKLQRDLKNGELVNAHDQADFEQGRLWYITYSDDVPYSDLHLVTKRLSRSGYATAAYMDEQIVVLKRHRIAPTRPQLDTLFKLLYQVIKINRQIPSRFLKGKG